MDVAPDHAGTASALTNAAGAAAGILSPVAFGRILDLPAAERLRLRYRSRSCCSGS
jgi:hypothetical protein